MSWDDESVRSALQRYIQVETKGQVENCCVRCRLRTLGVPCKLAGCDVYCLPQPTLERLCEVNNNHTEACANSCKLCLGLLTDQVLQYFCSVIQTKLKEFQVDDTFRISVKLCESYKDQLLQLACWTDCPLPQVDLKQCFKWYCGTEIERQLHKKFAVDSDVEIRIEVKQVVDVGKELEDMVSIVLAPIYFQGRYRKLSRRLSQSPWIVDNVRLAPDSIEECLYDYLMEQLGAKECRFSAGGREDVDVRMLGTGRPFIIQVLEPKCTSSYVNHERFLKEWSRRVLLRSGGQVQVLDAKISNASFSLKESEMMKQKTYRCVVYISKSLNEGIIAEYLSSLVPLTIEQYTPLRVLHRRSLAKRKRVIHSIQLRKMLNPHFGILDLVTDAGTYVKEFIHGDLGRTRPHLGSLLGCETDILQLDVLHVDIASDWG
ncbi:hypothetical protein GAYE_SCF34G4989 [Galdieria yellowstonensis]|uniref:tRNA pseudouridine(55) synthase n=1 Tax=Galdieria yellowstonensis TaxID=3028027 RepID=A0AAV9IIJ3_9RHOD|nr:hypothetical protein GAYE_SCF34G4989 [Galdieria yellowstonensis]